MKEIIGVIISAFVGVIAFFFVIGFLIITFINKPKCETLEEMTDRDTKFEIIGGCYIQADDGNYIPDDQFIINEPQGGK